MNEEDKQELIRLCLLVECSECGDTNNEYTNIDVTENNITIPNVPVIRCKTCNSIGYPSIAYDHIEAYKETHTSP